MLIKPISFWQGPIVAGGAPPVGLKSTYISGLNFYQWGSTQLGSTTAGGIAKVSPLGVLDTAWTNNANPSPTTNSSFGTLAGNGKVYVRVGTTTSTTNRVREIDATTGVVDRDFTYTGTIYSIKGLQSISDYFFIAASANYNMPSLQSGRGIVKVNTSTFERDMTFYTNAGTTARVDGLTVTPTKLGLTGAWASWNGNTANSRFVVLNHDGTVDSGFTRATGAFNIQPLTSEFFDNKWIVGGNFTTYNSITQTRIVAFNSDGSLNTTFNTNINSAGFNGAVINLYKLSETELLVVGNFTSSGQISNRIAILNTDGTVATNRFGTGFTNATPTYVNIDAANDLMYFSGNSFTEYRTNTSLFNAVSVRISDGSINTDFATTEGVRNSVGGVTLANAVF